jgi:hypothetical protein
MSRGLLRADVATGGSRKHGDVPDDYYEENSVKKSNKMIAAAAAGALLLTGGITAVANAVAPAARALPPRPRLLRMFSPHRKTLLPRTASPWVLPARP